MKRIFVAAAVILLIASCKTESGKGSSSTPDPLVVDIDSTVKPGDDFFEYANGNWIKNNPIPNSENSWGIGQLVNEEIYLRKKNINEKAINEKAAQGTISQKIADFYTTAMDTMAIEKAGLAPLQPDLDRVAKATSIDDLLKLNAEFRTKGSETMFSAGIGQDDMNSEKIAVAFYQGGLGMPNRDYYFEKDPKSTAVREAYQEMMVKIFQKLGMDNTAAAKAMNDVFAMETRLANASRKLADLRDPYRNYNKMALDKFETLAPNLLLDKYLPILGINKLDSVIVGQPEFYTALNTELKSTPLDVWKNEMRFNLITDFASYLDSSTYMIVFNYGKTLNGAKEPRPRWKRVLDAEENVMGEALGQLFVKEYFNETAKKRYEDLVEAIRTAYKERIEKLTWMSDSTKSKALDKLAKIKKKVGYPNKWKDFSAMEIGKTSYVQNMMNGRKWWFNYSVNKLGKPVDRDEWDMTPQTYNAYYNPSNNEIVLPAGMFAVPGKMDADLDDAFVYGYAAASTIGHEITHGFDDQGRQYDAQGNLKNWWTPKDSAEFTQRASMIIKQFDEFVPVDSLHVNGNATQGENIADLGGLLLGVDAFKKTDDYKNGKSIGGLTPMQRYFLGYAYSWMYQQRPEILASRLKTDVHAPAKERVNGPVVNIPEFYEAFGIKKGDKMYRADSLRVQIW